MALPLSVGVTNVNVVMVTVGLSLSVGVSNVNVIIGYCRRGAVSEWPGTYAGEEEEKGGGECHEPIS